MKLSNLFWGLLGVMVFSACSSDEIMPETNGPEFDGHKIDFDVAMKRQTLYKTEEGRALLKLREGDTHHGGCGNCGGDK